jgi:hypothetical protein
LIAARRSSNSSTGGRGGLGCSKASTETRNWSSNLSIERAAAPADGRSVGSIFAAISSAGFIRRFPTRVLRFQCVGYDRHKNMTGSRRKDAQPDCLTGDGKYSCAKRRVRSRDMPRVLTSYETGNGMKLTSLQPGAGWSRFCCRRSCSRRAAAAGRSMRLRPSRSPRPRKPAARC